MIDALLAIPVVFSLAMDTETQTAFRVAGTICPNHGPYFQFFEMLLLVMQNSLRFADCLTSQALRTGAAHQAALRLGHGCLAVVPQLYFGVAMQAFCHGNGRRGVSCFGSQFFGQELAPGDGYLSGRDWHLLGRHAAQIGFNACCCLLGGTNGVDNRHGLGDGVASGEHTGPVGHVRHSVYVERSFPGDGKAMSFAQEREVRRLPDGWHHHVHFQRELATGNGYGAASPRVVRLTQLHPDTLEGHDAPSLVAQDPHRRDQELDGNALTLGLVYLLWHSRHLRPGATVENSYILHPQPLQ